MVAIGIVEEGDSAVIERYWAWKMGGIFLGRSPRPATETEGQQPVQILITNLLPAAAAYAASVPTGLLAVGA